MASPQVRSLVHRVGSRVVRISGSQSAATFPSSKDFGFRSFASGTKNERVASLQAAGMMDSEGYTNFKTLHELQLSACAVFEPRNIFGTYAKDGDSGAFQWMSYGKFSALVDKTRSVLKDIGKHRRRTGDNCPCVLFASERVAF